MRGFHDPREEALERVWCLVESEAPATAQDFEDPAIASQIEVLVAEGLLLRQGGQITLSPEGEPVARHVVRANRLAARLLHDVLELPHDAIEGLACQLEHAISPTLADGICTLLGHPPTAIDGRPIPRGACCAALRTEVGPAVRPLHQIDIDGSGRVTFIHPRVADRLDRLSAMGLVPGCTLKLTQRSPAVVVELGHTTLALDAEVAKDIFVKPA